MQPQVKVKVVIAAAAAVVVTLAKKMAKKHLER